jgi:hypothetical protein
MLVRVMMDRLCQSYCSEHRNCQTSHYHIAPLHIGLIVLCPPDIFVKSIYHSRQPRRLIRLDESLDARPGLNVFFVASNFPAQHPRFRNPRYLFHTGAPALLVLLELSLVVFDDLDSNVDPLLQILYGDQSLLHKAANVVFGAREVLRHDLVRGLDCAGQCFFH